MTGDELQVICNNLRCHDWYFRWISHGSGFLLYVEYSEPDTVTGVMSLQRSRYWFINWDASESEVVQTALKAVLTSAEHRVRESFTYYKAALFNPHHNVGDLLNLARREQSKSRA